VSILAGEIEVKAVKEIDTALVRACQRGDIEAFEQIFRVYRNPVFRLAYRFTGNRDDAEDLTQEIFLKVFENIGSFRYESSFATWLYRIAVNTCMNFQRDKKPAESLGVTNDFWEVALALKRFVSGENFSVKLKRKLRRFRTR